MQTLFCSFLFFLHKNQKITRQMPWLNSQRCEWPRLFSPMVLDWHSKPIHALQLHAHWIICPKAHDFQCNPPCYHHYVSLFSLKQLLSQILICPSTLYPKSNVATFINLRSDVKKETRALSKKEILRDYWSYWDEVWSSRSFSPYLSFSPLTLSKTFYPKSHKSGLNSLVENMLYNLQH